MVGVLRRLAALRRRHVARADLGARGEREAPGQPAADWVWCPAVWSERLDRQDWPSVPAQARLADTVTLHHDGAPEAVSLRQTGPDEGSAFGLTLKAGDFRGTYLSLAIAFPPMAARALRRTHLLRLTLIAEADRGQVVYVRLNIRHGPNVEQIVRRLSEASEKVVEFDLCHSDVTEVRIADAWIDVILERPSHVTVLIRDLVVSRRARAAF